MPVDSQEALEAVVGETFHARVKATLRPLITPELIAEHRRTPLGQHSEPLQRVLNYLGALPIDGKLITEHDGADHWFVSRLVGFPAVRADRILGPFDTEGGGDGRGVPPAPRGCLRTAAQRLMARFDAWALGYPDELCLRPGETVGFHVSGAGAETVDAQLVKLIHGDTQPGGPGFREVEVPSTVDGTYPLRDQPTHHGSYARIPDAGSILGAL